MGVFDDYGYDDYGSDDCGNYSKPELVRACRDYAKKLSSIENMYKEQVNKCERSVKEQEKLLKENLDLRNKIVDLSKNIETNNNEGDVKDMDNKFNNMFGEFGAVKAGELALTINGGIAVKRGENEYVRYNANTEQMENQMDMVIEDANDFMFIMPTQEVEVGDIIKAKNTYYQVLEIKANKSLRAVNIKSGSKSTLLKETNLFGIGFWSKVTCLFNMNAGSTTEGMNPMMLMLMMKDKDNSKDGSGFDMKTLMMMQAFGGMNTGNTNGFNPMMLMAMGGKMDMGMLAMMSMANGGQNILGVTPPVKKETTPEPPQNIATMVEELVQSAINKMTKDKEENKETEL